MRSLTCYEVTYRQVAWKAARVISDDNLSLDSNLRARHEGGTKVIASFERLTGPTYLAMSTEHLCSQPYQEVLFSFLDLCTDIFIVSVYLNALDTWYLVLSMGSQIRSKLAASNQPTDSRP